MSIEKYFKIYRNTLHQINKSLIVKFLDIRFIIELFGASRGAGAQVYDCERYRLIMGSIPITPPYEVKYLIFNFIKWFIS